MDTIRLGALKVSNIWCPFVPGKPFICRGGDIEFGNTPNSSAVRWFPAANLLVCTQAIVNYVSWDQLRKLGFITGKPITIDGFRFIIRAPSLKEEQKGCSEWFSIVQTAKQGDFFKAGLGASFWGQDDPGVTDDEYFSERLVVNANAVEKFSLVPSGNKVDSVGYLPVLEPAPGTDVFCFPNRRCIGAEVIEEDDFDVVVKTNAMGQQIAVQAGAGIVDGEYLVIAKEAAVAILHGRRA